MQKFFLILIVVALGFFIGQQEQVTSTKIDDLLLENVEALASEELALPILCRLTGNYVCPGSGARVAIIYKGYSLEPDEENY